MRVKVQFVVQVNPTTSDWTKWVVKAWILSSEQTLVWLLRAGAGRLNTIKVQLVSHVGVFTIYLTVIIIRVAGFITRSA